MAAALLAACGRDTRPATRPHGFTHYQAVQRAASPDSAEFTQILSMDLDSRRNIYVADAYDVAVLSPDARPLRRVGRQGKGPGEFDGVTDVRLLPGDSLFVFDAGSARVTVFDPGSDHPAHTVSLSTAGLFFPYQVAPLPDGGLLGVFRAAFGVGPDGGERGQRLETIRAFNPDASLRRDSVLTFPEYHALDVTQGPMSGSLFSPFIRRTLVAVDGDRIYTAWSDDWRVAVHSATGKNLGTIQPSDAPRPRPITDAEMDSVVSKMKADLPFSRETIQRAMEAAGTRTWPLLQALLVDDAGTVWLAVAGQRGEPTHWVGVDAQGKRVGAFDLSERVTLHLIRDGAAYGVLLDDDDVPHVVIYDLKPVHDQPRVRS
ncbi:MAG TPA: hypothetical protein VF771_01690 [Longimicrobiaceae bacterium]